MAKVAKIDGHEFVHRRFASIRPPCSPQPPWPNSGARGAGLNSGTSASTTGALCVNVYTFSPDEQMVSCCSCPVTPNGLVSLSARQDLISNTLEVVKLTSLGSVVALHELMFAARSAQQVTFNYSPLVLAMVMYFLLLWPVVRLLSRLEHRRITAR